MLALCIIKNYFISQVISLSLSVMSDSFGENEHLHGQHLASLINYRRFVLNGWFSSFKRGFTARFGIPVNARGS